MATRAGWLLLSSALGALALQPGRARADEAACLVIAAWDEARGEPREVIEAVVSTILNRARARGVSVCDAVMDPAAITGVTPAMHELFADAATPHDQPTAQPHTAHDRSQLAIVRDAAVAALAGSLPDRSRGATHFYSPAGMRALGMQAPRWAASMRKTASVGPFVFLREPGRGAPFTPVPSAAPAGTPSAAPAAAALATAALAAAATGGAPPVGQAVQIVEIAAVDPAPAPSPRPPHAAHPAQPIRVAKAPAQAAPPAPRAIDLPAAPAGDPWSDDERVVAEAEAGMEADQPDGQGMVPHIQPSRPLPVLGLPAALLPGATSQSGVAAARPILAGAGYWSPQPGLTVACQGPDRDAILVGVNDLRVRRGPLQGVRCG